MLLYILAIGLVLIFMKMTNDTQGPKLKAIGIVTFLLFLVFILINIAESQFSLEHLINEQFKFMWGGFLGLSFFYGIWASSALPTISRRSTSTDYAVPYDFIGRLFGFLGYLFFCVVLLAQFSEWLVSIR